MPMPDKLVRAFNDQISRELASSNAYLQMAAYLEGASLPGMAAWMRIQADEERAHGLRLFEFMVEREEDIEIQSLPAPRADFTNTVEVFEASLAQERAVTAAIHDLYALAHQEQDFASLPLLNWFITEQIEEEATVSQIIDDLRRIGDDGAALLLLDRELGSRPPGEEDGE